MFIPLEGENVLCLANAVALYRENDKTIILRRNGTKETAPFTPQTLKKRGEALWEESAL
ncbi:hypothetical protein LJC40_03295 [Synergistaceae bacterium OttesenSCG-928-D05]|nr:hypothetical protein [Synergistaceae bacterium OttesenSCG-928-D05]